VRRFVNQCTQQANSIEQGSARGSLESRVLPAARKFKDLRAAMGDEIAEIQRIDESPTSATVIDPIEPA